jgi:hypothetical protein
VARHLRLSAPDSNPAKAPIGSEPSDGDPKPANAPLGSDEGVVDPKPAKAPIGSGAAETTGTADDAGRLSDCAPWREVIRSKLDLGLTAQRIFQDLVADHGFTGSYDASGGSSAGSARSSNCRSAAWSAVRVSDGSSIDSNRPNARTTFATADTPLPLLEVPGTSSRTCSSSTTWA